MGNINDKIDIDMELFQRYNELNVLQIDRCKSCWIRYLCAGDCCHNSFLRMGSLSTPDPVMCDFFVFLAETAIKIVSKMQDIDNENYKIFKRLIKIREKNTFIH